MTKFRDDSYPLDEDELQGIIERTQAHLTPSEREIVQGNMDRLRELVETPSENIRMYYESLSRTLVLNMQAWLDTKINPHLDGIRLAAQAESLLGAPSD